MTTRIWSGGTGLWTDPSAWEGGVAPLPDDTAVATAGTIDFSTGETLNAATIDIGSDTSDAPAALVLSDALLGFNASLDSSGIGVGGDVLLDDIGDSGFQGVINATAPDGTFEIDASSSGATPGNLTVLNGAVITVSGGDTMLLNGTLNLHATVDLDSAGTFVNDGTVDQSAAAFEVDTGATLGGTGLFEIGLYSSLNLENGSGPSSENVRFTDVGGRLLMADPANFTGIVTNFLTGDLIDLTSIIANHASYDPSNDLLTVTDNGSIVATLTLDAPAGDQFFTTPDGDTGTLVELQGTQVRLNYTIDAADRAVGANTVRATMTTDAGTPITGAGVRVGIISDSFNLSSPGTPDPADAAAAAGYLPETASGTSAVTVLTEGDAGDDNEGLALAELVHQEAPGASLDFASADGGLDSFASAVTQLQQAGCNVIVDDVSYDTEPFFQDAGPLDTAIDNAVASGVTYITSAGNAGAAGYLGGYNGVPETLYNGTNTPAELFANGTPYQDVTLLAGTTATFDLQWAVPYQSTQSGDTLQMELFNASDRLVASSAPNSTLDDGGDEAGASLSFTPTTNGQYQLAIYGTMPATTFEYILLGSAGGGTTVGGIIDDPAANAGAIYGHAMLPDVISVGAVDFPETPAFGSTTGYTDFYSSAGPAEFLFDADGNPITPDIVAGPDVVSPVDAGTTVFAPFDGTSAAAASAAGVAALMLQADPALTPAQAQSMMKQSAASLGQPAAVQGSGLIDAPAAVQLALDAAPCYAAGTRIATARGLVAVERLRVGDLAVTEAGALRPVVWLGHRRVDCRFHPRPHDVWPVRVQAHAFAPGQPARDLLLSPDHAVKYRGALIPIRYLVNGASVVQVAVATVTYWHVELPTHDVLLAEGLPAESFLDTGNRAAFGDGGVASPHRDFARRVWAERGCAKLLTEGPALAAAHAHLLARAVGLGHRLGRDPGVRVLAAERTLPVHTEGRRCQARLPAGAKTLRLRSQTWVPAHLGEPDARRLGVAIAGLTLDGRRVDLGDARLCAGWHADEGEWRWTDGAATLLTAGARAIAFELAVPGRYWQQARGSAPRPRRGREAPDPLTAPTSPAPRPLPH